MNNSDKDKNKPKEKERFMPKDKEHLEEKQWKLYKELVKKWTKPTKKGK